VKTLTAYSSFYNYYLIDIGIKQQPEAIVASSVQPKLDSVKIGASASTVPKPMAMHKTITHHATSGMLIKTSQCQNNTR